jgi:iron-sulfur cluster assembly accessory protein
MEKEGALGHGLRVAIVPGGCSGYEYSMEFKEAPAAGDEVFEVDGLTVYVDGASVEKLTGTVLDFVDGLHGAGLQFRNPQAVHACGCGSSFSTE